MLNDIKDENERIRLEISVLRREKGLPDEEEKDDNYVDPGEDDGGGGGKYKSFLSVQKYESKCMK